MEKFKIEFKWASIFTAINLIWIYIEKYLGLHDKYIDYHSIVSLVMLLPLVFAIIMALKQKKRDYYKGEMTWQKAFASGALLSLLIAGLSPGPIYVMSEFVSPNFFEIALSKGIAKGIPEDFAKQLYNLDAYIKSAIFFYLAFGIMISAVVGLIIKKRSE